LSKATCYLVVYEDKDILTPNAWAKEFDKTQSLQDISLGQAVVSALA
jgi:hypothetical protein